MNQVSKKTYIILAVVVLLLLAVGVFKAHNTLVEEVVGSSEHVAAIKYTPLQSLPGIGIEKEQEVTTLSTGLFSKVVFFIIGIAIVLAILMIVIGGIQYMGSDAFTSKEDAKSKITMALFGLLIAFGAWLLLNTINPDLVTFRILESTKNNETEDSETTTSGTGTESGYYIGNERFDKLSECLTALEERDLPISGNNCPYK